MGEYSAFGHPAMFPEKLAHDHIISWSNEGDTVLDCFFGSGTTGKIALKTNRKIIGIEKDPDYFEIARKRVEDAARELRGEFKTLRDDKAHNDLPLFTEL